MAMTDKRISVDRHGMFRAAMTQLRDSRSLDLPTAQALLATSVEHERAMAIK